MVPTVIQEREITAPYSSGPVYNPGDLGPRLPSDHAATPLMPEIMNEIVPEDPMTAKRILRLPKLDPAEGAYGLE